MHHPTDRIAHTTAFVTPVVEHWLEREIADMDEVHSGHHGPSRKQTQEGKQLVETGDSRETG